MSTTKEHAVGTLRLAAEYFEDIGTRITVGRTTCADLHDSICVAIDSLDQAEARAERAEAALLHIYDQCDAWFSSGATAPDDIRELLKGN
jgi:hypothetical protein